MIMKRRGRPKFCAFCKNNNEVSYKDVDVLKRYISDRGKILPRRVTANCAKHQRTVASAIKRARHIALIPFVAN